MFKKLLILIISHISLQQDIFLGEKQESGFIPLSASEDIFYWLFRSRSDAPSYDPLVIWLTGGPGCASELAIFYENGPFAINDDLTLNRNEHSWNNNANLLYVDQPVGTGFSKAKLSDLDRSEKQIAEDFYDFMFQFVIHYPEFEGKPIYITGESYAGHYIPSIAAYIQKQFNPMINVQGFAIGNGWTNPKVQYPAYNTFAFENQLIGKATHMGLTAGFKLCQGLIASGIWPVALEGCQLMVTAILGNPLKPKFNVYDIRKKCDFPPLCYDFDNLDKFLKQEEVIKALKTDGRKWESCNMKVHTFLLGDWMTNQAENVAYLLDNQVKGLVYSGDKDFICNWRGGEAWTNELEWSKKDEFQNSTYQDWIVDGQKAGEFKQAGNLKFLKVADAGHMVPMDQPANALRMLNDFIQM